MNAYLNIKLEDPDMLDLIFKMNLLAIHRQNNVNITKVEDRVEHVFTNISPSAIIVMKHYINQFIDHWRRWKL